MNNPQRHDIFEDENGARVAVNQVFPPNAMGVTYVEYKNLTDSNLRFSPQEEFLEKFKWVDNFGSTDTHIKIGLQKIIEAPSGEATPKKEGSEGEEGFIAEAEVSSEVEKTGEAPAAKPSRSE